MNTLKSQSKYELSLDNTRARLREWGYWCNAILTMGLKLPSVSILGQMVELKGELIKSTAPRLAPENEIAEEIDDLVNQLSKQEPEKAKILCIHYIERRSNKEKFKKANMPRTSYFRLLLSAENWIYNHIR